MTGSNQNLQQFPVLIGDIGGTHARFQIVTDRHAEPKSFGITETKDFKTIEDAIEETVLNRTSSWPKSAILAAAGPITSAGLKLTNSHWNIDPHQLMQTSTVADLILLNDFEAQALAITSFEDTDLFPVGAGKREPLKNSVVLGPGTGLGVAGLVRAAGTWIPVAGEGGHVDLGPRSRAERDIWDHLETIEGRVSAEQLVCGRGICNIYQAIEKASKRSGDIAAKDRTPAAISDAALSGSDDIAVESMELFCTALGRVAGDLALTFMATGGVFIAGGIGRKISPFLAKSGFRAAFEDKAPHKKLLAGIATSIVTHELPALAGLAAFACAPDRFGIETAGRRWIADRQSEAKAL